MRRDDAASTHALEAVIIASIMISAVAFVATFETPPSATSPARVGLQQRAEDALQILYDTPSTNKTLGDNALSVLLAECLRNNCTDLETKLAKLLPPGASYALYLSNGYSTYPVLVQRQPTGEAVSATQLLEPRWSSSFVATATDAVNPGEDPLLVYTLPIFNSNPVSPGGSPLFVRVSGTRSDGSDYILTSFHTTYAHDGGDAVAPAVSLFFADAAGNPMATTNLTQFTLNAQGAITRAPVPMQLRLQETQGASFGEGAELVVHVPRGWSAAGNATLNGADWTVVAQATDRNASATGSAIVARLERAVASGSVDFHFDAIYHGDLVDYYPFHARLSQGTAASASLLVRGDRHTAQSSFEVPSLHLSVPRPMGKGAGAQTTWTLGALIPHNETSLQGNLTQAVTVHKVEIIEQDRRGIFGSVSAIRAEGGAWSNGGDSLVWHGNVTLGQNRTLNLSFNVVASGKRSAAPIGTGLTPPIAFDSFTGRIVGQSGQGFHRGIVFPAGVQYGGYTTASGGSVFTNRDLRSDAVYRSTALPGGTEYRVGPSTTVEDALYGSYVGVETRSVPIGGEVVLTANVQSLLFKLAHADQQAGVTLRFYPPWSGEERTAIHEQKNLDRGVLTGDVTAMVTLDLNGDGWPDPIVGTSNGRVLAYHALTGQRLQGNVFTLPARTQGSLAAAPAVTHLALTKLGTEDYVVVGTDGASTGVFVLNRTFGAVWRFDMGGDATLGLDTTMDFDKDGRRDIVVARAYESNSLVYVLRALAGNPILQPYRPQTPVFADPDAFYLSAGTPDAIVGLARTGPWGDMPGFAISRQTTVDGGVRIYPDWSAPQNTAIEEVPLSTPRAGLQVVDGRGNETSVLFGSPVTKARPYDYDRDGITDIVSGGPGGYVFMSNGTVVTQPLYSYVVSGAQQIVSGDALNALEAYALSDDGQILYTDDAWQTLYCTACEVPLPTAQAVAARATNSIWAVGAASAMWKSVPSPIPATLNQPHYLQGVEMKPVTDATFTRATAGYDLAQQVHSLNDVWFRGDVGYVVGSPCAREATCTEALLMKTIDGGKSWKLATHADGSLKGSGDAWINGTLHRIRFNANGTGFAVGTGGLIVRTTDGGATWHATPPLLPTAHTLRDVHCNPRMPWICMAVGTGGTALITFNSEAATPWWLPLPVEERDGVLARDFYSVGIVDEQVAYIGSRNMVLGTFTGGAHWTSLPLNYIENDARSIVVNPDGSGYIFGGSLANARIWMLQDYHTESMLQTKSFSSLFPADARVKSLELIDANATVGSGRVEVRVATAGDDWRVWGNLTPLPLLHPSQLLSGTWDPRNVTLPELSLPTASTGRDLRFQLRFNTSGDRTISTPVVRDLHFRVQYLDGTTTKTAYVDLDFSSDAQVDPDVGTAVWSPALRAAHQPYVKEFWTRNVSGEVRDLQTGFDLDGDTWDEVWVGTGGVLAVNSPDYAIYAGTDENKWMRSDNRVYLLDGRTGRTLAQTDSFAGNVTHLRVASRTGGSSPDIVFVTTYDPSTMRAKLHGLDPASLAVLWSHDVGPEEPKAMRTGTIPHGLTAYLGTARNAAEKSAPHLHHVNASTPPRPVWRVVPDDIGKYIITKKIPDNWFFGAYVVEIAVEWNETISTSGVPETVLRSARFYDHFMVTPPDAVSPPAPIYNVRLVAWMPEWG